MITLNDFQKLDIRIGTVISVKKVPNMDKLLQFNFEVGGETRQIIAGMAAFFPEFEILIGKQMPLLLNIEPRVFKNETSHGMIVAADVSGRPIFLAPEEKIPAGSLVK